MAKCVNEGCNNSARLDLIATGRVTGHVSGGGYHGGSWCSVRCLLATPFSTLADAYPGQVERPEPETQARRTA